MSELPNPDKLDGISGRPVPANDIEPAFDTRTAGQYGNYYSDRPQSSAPNTNRGGNFTPLTWAMIVVAGILLGFAIAMTFAGA